MPASEPTNPPKPPTADPDAPVVAVTFRVTRPIEQAIRGVLGSRVDVRFVFGADPEERSRALGAARVLLSLDPHRELDDAGREATHGVGLIQLISAGVDHLRWDEVPGGAIVAGNVGAYAEPIAEHVLAMVLALAKRLPERQAAMARGEYPRSPLSRSLRGRVCGVLGFGGIGRSAAQLLRALGMRIHAVNSTGRTDQPVEWAGTLEDLDEVLAVSDVLLVALPMTRATRGLIGRAQLERMKPDAILVNVARAAIVDEDALFDHLRAHPEFSAGLDVWWDEPKGGEPFRPRRPFPELSNVIASPHNSGDVPGIEVVAARHAARNVARFLDGQAVAGVASRGNYETASPPPWWKEAVIYQVYLRSFADADGDGIGDLDGLTGRLGPLTELGVDAVWLSPVHPSPNADWGYDVMDYAGVDPVYGGMAAFDRFLEAAHAAGLRVLLDFVPNHTSDRHPWFVEASSSRDSPRRDWYYWSDGRTTTGGGRAPPNNWESGFGGSAWRWHEPTGQYVLASFYSEQVDLNWRNPGVREAVCGAMRGWVDRGVDGFRVDVVHRLGKDPELRDNELAGVDRRSPEHTSLRRFDENWPTGHHYLRQIRRAVGDDTLLLGEVWLLNLEDVFRYLRPGELDLAFNFSFASNTWDARSMAASIEWAERMAKANGWPCYHLSNHDEPRHASRYGAGAIRAGAVMLLTLRGTPVLYYGEEIGMANGEVPADRRRDRAGRDPQRTPMQWDGSPNAGFCPSEATPWLPLAAGHETLNVASEAREPESVLALYRRLLKLRRASSALRRGSYRRLPGPAGALVYLREQEGERLAVACNLTGEEVVVAVPESGRVLVATSVAREGERSDGELALGPHEAVILAPDPV